MTDQPQEAARPKRAAFQPDPHFRQFTAKQRLSAFRLRMLQRWRRHKVIFPVTSLDGKTVYPVTYAYGIRSRSYALGYHTGEDHAAPIGSAARATTYGRVVYAGAAADNHGWGADYGLQIVIRTADGKYDYAHNHLSHMAQGVKAGTHVAPGMLLARTGESGNVTGPHSHFEVRPAGGGFGSDVHPYLVKRKKH